ncbi:MAG: hypothetical protein FWC94_01200 [Bacteroidales bacterium]|nr:hypothetical protein [Bacteroidales bacterium]
MKKTFIIIGILAILISGCRNRSNDANMQEKSIPCSEFANNMPIWSVGYCVDVHDFYLVRGNLLDCIKHDIKKVILAWNENSAIKIEFAKIENGTLYVNIPDSEKLTQRMGSTGAWTTMAAMVYTLTETHTYVYIDFVEGDHAGPGKYSRKSFQFSVRE